MGCDGLSRPETVNLEMSENEKRSKVVLIGGNVMGSKHHGFEPPGLTLYSAAVAGRPAGWIGPRRRPQVGGWS